MGLNNKDAFDIFRLLRAVDTDEFASEVEVLLSSPISAPVTVTAITRFRELFETAAGAGTQLVTQHVEGLEDPATIVRMSVTLSRDLIEGVV